MQTKEENYISHASFVNLDFIPNYREESKRTYRIKGEKTTINAEFNGNYNILSKIVPTDLLLVQLKFSLL